MLDEHHRVGQRHAVAQQMVGVLRRRRHGEPQPGSVHDPGFEALRMLGSGRAPGPALRAQDHRHADLPPEHVADLGGLVGHLVHGEAEEVDIHEFRDRSQPRHGSADGGADDSRLADRRVEQAFGAELVDQVLGDPVGAAIEPDLLADDDDGRVGPHSILQGLAERIAVGDLCHGHVPCQTRASTRSMRVRRGSGSGSPIAKTSRNMEACGGGCGVPGERDGGVHLLRSRQRRCRRDRLRWPACVPGASRGYGRSGRACGRSPPPRPSGRGSCPCGHARRSGSTTPS